jgi:hypothetical protein
MVTQSAPTQRDAADYECPATQRAPQVVRLVRQIASTGKVRVLMTNLLDITHFLAAAFDDLYHRHSEPSTMAARAALPPARTRAACSGSSSVHPMADPVPSPALPP